MQATTLGQIADVLKLAVPDEERGRRVTGINTLVDAAESELSFISHDRYVEQLARTRAGVILAQERVRVEASPGKLVLRVADADLAVGRILPLFAPPSPRPAVGVDPLARVGEGTVLGAECAVGAFVSIGKNVRMGARCVLHPGVVIGDDVTVGDDCEFFANVVLRERVSIGDRVTIHAGSVLGTDGFGYRWNGSAHEKIPQIGTVIVEDDVEIGSCVCIDRAKFAATRIGRGSKIDNLAQIGHNVTVGPHCIIVGQAGLAGSARLGAGVVLGGQVAVRDHINIGDGAMAAACAAIAEDVPPKAIVSGMPALPHRQSLREQAALRRLPELVAQVRKLQEQVTALSEARQGGAPLKDSGE